MPTKKTLLTLAAGVALGCLATVAIARETLNDFGGVRSHEIVEEFDMSIGVTPQSQPLRATSVLEVRQEVHVPDFYGRLIAVTGVQDNAVLWYQDEGGTVRNAILEKASKSLYAVKLEETKRRRGATQR